MHRVVPLVVTAFSLHAQTPVPPQTRLTDALPSGVRATQITLTADARRAYYGDSARAIWLYDRADKRNVRLVDGEVFDLTLASTGNALAYARTGAGSADHHVWILPLDVRTGLASGPERRASVMQGDAPSISPDEKWLAFAADDSVGVGQGIVIVPMGGGRERTVVPFMRASVSTIRWSRDGKSLYYGVNPPVACDPEWSCLPLRDEFKQTTGSVWRVAIDGRAPASVATKVGNGWPGLAADGSLLAYTEGGFPGRMIVADTTGKQLASFPLFPRQTTEGWLSGSTLLFSDRGDVRRLRSYSLADSSQQLLDDSVDPITETAWAPDGKTISSLRCSPSACQLRLNRADGSPRESVDLPDRVATGTAWSPDQRWIAYIGGLPNGDRFVTAVEVGTGKVQKLATVRSNTANLLWLPDSKGLVVSFTTGNGATRRVSFQRVDLSGASKTLGEFTVGPTPSGGSAIDASTAFIYTGGEIKRVTFDGNSAETPWLPKSAWDYGGAETMSASAGRIAFRRFRTPDDDLPVIEVVSLNGSGRTTIEVPFHIPGLGGLHMLPDGSRLIVSGFPTGEPGVGVYLITVDTKTVQKLFTIPSASFTNQLTVSPDGRTVLYVTNEVTSPRVYTMDLSSLKSTGRQ